MPDYLMGVSGECRVKGGIEVRWKNAAAKKTAVSGEEGGR